MAAAALMRIVWRAVGGIGVRVAAAAQRDGGLLGGLVRVGIDEIGRRRVMIVVCHDAGRLVWARAGRGRAPLKVSLGGLGARCCA